MKTQPLQTNFNVMNTPPMQTNFNVNASMKSPMQTNFKSGQHGANNNNLFSPATLDTGQNQFNQWSNMQSTTTNNVNISAENGSNQSENFYSGNNQHGVGIQNQRNMGLYSNVNDPCSSNYGGNYRGHETTQYNGRSNNRHMNGDVNHGAPLNSYYSNNSGNRINAEAMQRVNNNGNYADGASAQNNMNRPPGRPPIYPRARSTNLPSSTQLLAAERRKNDDRGRVSGASTSSNNRGDEALVGEQNGRDRKNFSRESSVGCREGESACSQGGGGAGRVPLIYLSTNCLISRVGGSFEVKFRYLQQDNSCSGFSGIRLFQ